MYINSVGSALMGVQARESGGGDTHTVRASFWSPGVIQHNHLGKSRTNFVHILKLHAPRWDDGTSWTGGRFNDRIVISDNTFENTTLSCASWMVAVGPQNADSDERLRDVILERNFFLNVRGTGLLIWGRDVTARNNLFHQADRETRDFVGIYAGDRGGMPRMDLTNVRIYNNSFYSQLDATVGIRIEPPILSGFVRNNLLFAPNASSSITIQNSSSGLTASNNLGTTSSPYLGSSMRSAVDYRINAESSVADSIIDRGMNTCSVVGDYSGLNSRPIDGDEDGTFTSDIGAFEYRDGASIPEPPGPAALPQPPVLIEATTAP
jgi:hypothetical protein